MKKIIAISLGVYSIVCVGSCVYMIVDPEGYGRLLGKIAKGYIGALELTEGGEI